MKKQYRSLLQIEILLIALSPFLPLLVQGQLIPSTNRTDWTPGVMTGVPGGIPNYRTNLIDVTQSPFNADNSGTVDASAAIQAAINTNTTHTNDVIYLPAGTYKVGSTISLTRNGITMRGAGTNLTVMN